jgi:hypothetical protein
MAILGGVLGLAAACVPPPTYPPQCPGLQSGLWVGSWESIALAPAGGAARATVIVSGTSIAGTATMSDSVFPSGDLAGTIDCERVTLGLFAGAVTFNGTIGSDGRSVTGTYDAPGIADNGTFELSLEPTLAVAYSNLDGVAGYDPAGSDVLITRLVDTNSDGVASIGDTVEFGQYPLDFDATTFGDFGTSSAAVTAMPSIPYPPANIGVWAAGWFYVWNDSPTADSYIEKASEAPAGIEDPLVSLQDAVGAEPMIDVIVANPPGPVSNPDTAIPFVTRPAGADDAFFDIDIH